MSHDKLDLLPEVIVFAGPNGSGLFSLWEGVGISKRFPYKGSGVLEKGGLQMTNGNDINDSTNS